MNLTLSVITSAAIIDSINPCAISVLLLTIGFLSSLKKPIRQILIYGLLYILGIYLIYLLIGLGTLRALTFFGIPKAVSKFGALILIFTGIINLLGRMFPRFPVKLEIPRFAKPGIARLIYASSLPAIFMMGIIVGLFEFPCTGGPYLMILSLLHDQSTSLSGLSYLLYYNLLFISPLIVILLISVNPSLSRSFQNFRARNSVLSDLLTSISMIILGLVILISVRL